MDNPYITFDDTPKPVEAPARGTVKPLLFIPYGRDVYLDSWVANCMNDIIGQGWPRIKTEANATDIQRNQGAQALLDAPAEYNALVMLDADHRHPPGTVHALVKALEERPDAGLIVAINFRRRQPYDPCCWIQRDGEVYQPVKWDRGWVGPLFRTGLAACIIPRRTFEVVKRPWFANTYTVAPDGREIVYKREDFYFADKVRAAGLEIWADGRIEASPHQPNLPGWVDGTWWAAYVEKHPKLVAQTLPPDTQGG
jgi:hypothetical protein